MAAAGRPSETGRLPAPPADRPSGMHPPTPPLAADADDLAAFDRRPPLANLSSDLQDLAELDSLSLGQLAAAAAEASSAAPEAASTSFWQLPPEVRAAYCELRATLAAVLLPGGTPPSSEHNGAGPAVGGNGTAPPPLLPWRRYGAGSSKRAAQHAAEWLGQQLEAAEVQKAHLRRAVSLCCLGATPCSCRPSLWVPSLSAPSSHTAPPPSCLAHPPGVQAERVPAPVGPRRLPRRRPAHPSGAAGAAAAGAAGRACACRGRPAAAAGGGAAALHPAAVAVV